ncbi:MAG: hypothetical protein K6B67_02155 [Lachnospiraceae bacterium]|nr:hypothetical protein [Lachnospiraceae bacterium]
MKDKKKNFRIVEEEKKQSYKDPEFFKQETEDSENVTNLDKYKEYRHDLIDELYNEEKPEDYDLFAALKALYGIDEGPVINRYNQHNLYLFKEFAEYIRASRTSWANMSEILGDVNLDDIFIDDDDDELDDLYDDDWSYGLEGFSFDDDKLDDDEDDSSDDDKLDDEDE